MIYLKISDGHLMSMRIGSDLIPGLAQPYIPLAQDRSKIVLGFFARVRQEAVQN